ncbi:MAG: CopG family ribbon-helix-helix protein [Candidatus Micrarchaeia archaeon]
MEILSLSIDDKTLEKLNETQRLLKFKSRSKLLRTAIMNITIDYNEINTASGNIECVFVLTYKENEKNHVSDLVHKYKDIIKTEVHHHSYGSGVDIIISSSDADNIRKMFSSLRASKCIYSVSYSLLGKE